MLHIRGLRPLTALLSLLLLASSASPRGVSAANIIAVPSTAAGALQLGQTIVADPSVLSGAVFVTTPPAGTPSGIGSHLGVFPTHGSSFAILTSGNALRADDPTYAPPGASDGGGSIRGNTDFDVTILEVDLTAPASAACLRFDFAFYSQEFPNFVGSSFNDAFIAELDKSSWTTSGSTITAADNFAFDPTHQVISVNSTGATSMTALNAAGTGYGGATTLLQAATPVTPGAHKVFLSIFDQGDHIYDSAVFLDNLRFDNSSNCAPGAKPAVARPTIFLPGIMGSFLRDKNGSEIWPNQPTAALEALFGDGFLHAAAFQDDGVTPEAGHDNTPVTVDSAKGVNGAIDTLDLGVLGSTAIYKHSLDHLKSLGYVVGNNANPQTDQTLFVLGFDWRLSAATNAVQVLNLINRVTAGTGASSVDILAHSQGGLVTNALVHDPGAVGKVNRVVTMGTPYLGAPKLLAVLEYHDPCITDPKGGFFCPYDMNTVGQVSRNMPGALELSPSAAYYNASSATQPSPIRIDWDINKNGIKPGDLSYADVLKHLAADQNIPLLKAAAQWHASVDLWQPADPTVQLARVVGAGLHGPETVREFQELRCSRAGCFPVLLHEILPGDGDGTVPTHSADLNNPARGFDYRNGAADAYANGVAHVGLPQTDYVLDYAAAFFSQSRATASASVAPSAKFAQSASPESLEAQSPARQAVLAQPKPLAKLAAATPSTSGIMDHAVPFSSTDIFVMGPASGSLVDSAGNLTGLNPANGLLVEHIPGSDLFVSNLTATYSVSTPDTYRATWTATDDGQFQFTVRDYVDGQLATVAAAPRVTLSKGAVVKLSLARPVTYAALALAVDDTGAGTTTRTIAFNPPLTGAAALDRTPPTSTIVVTNAAGADGLTHAMVSLSATDEPGGSGVNRIDWWVTETGQSGTYSGTPLVLPGNGTILVRAIDNAGNGEAPAKSAKLDVTPPTTTASVLPAPNAAGWNNTDATVNLVATDTPGGSGVAQITYSLSGAQNGGATVKAASVAVPVTTEGITTITFSALDQAGNAEATRSLTVRVDKSPPVTSATPGPGALPPFLPLLTVTANATVQSTTGTTLGSIAIQCWDTRGAVVKLTALDTGSGVSSLTYAATGGQTIPSTTVIGGTAQPSITAAGVTILTYAATDLAGNREAMHSETILVGRGEDGVGYSCAAPTPTFPMPRQGKLLVTGVLNLGGSNYPFSKTINFGGERD